MKTRISIIVLVFVLCTITWHVSAKMHSVPMLTGELTGIWEEISNEWLGSQGNGLLITGIPVGNQVNSLDNLRENTVWIKIGDEISFAHKDHSLYFHCEYNSNGDSLTVLDKRIGKRTVFEKPFFSKKSTRYFMRLE